MPEKCEVCSGTKMSRRESSMILERIFLGIDLWEEYLAEEEEICSQCDCSCHSCAAQDCSVKILRKDKYCDRHTVSSGNNWCKECYRGTDDIRWSWRKEDFFHSPVVTSDGYCRYHEKQCAGSSCSQRVASNDKYCYLHGNMYCQVSGCHQQTPNSRQSNTYIYCSEHLKLYGNSLSNYQQAQQQEKIKQQAQHTEQTKLKSLVKANTSIAGEIAEVERFSPWFNPNCATVIASADNYSVYLVVYETAVREMKKIISSLKIKGDYSTLTAAQSVASSLRGRLQNSANPILEVNPWADSYTAFSNLVSEPYVKKECLPVEHIYPPRTYFSMDDMVGGNSDSLIFNDTAGENMPIAKFLNGESPDKYIKPGDIVWVLRKNISSYYHVCVYLGNEKVCHILNKEGAKIQNWKEFIKDNVVSLGRDELIRFHPIIPFKNYKTIAENIAWANLVGFRNKDSSEKYCLANRNCEHFANMAVLGINFSKQVYDRPNGCVSACFSSDCLTWNGGCKDDNGKFTPQGNNNKGSTINPTSEINTKYLGEYNNRESQEIEARIEQAMPSYIPTDNCRIM